MVSDMMSEVVSMLELFGLPYVVSPFEADAQCGFLEQKGLVDGTIT